MSTLVRHSPLLVAPFAAVALALGALTSNAQEPAPAEAGREDEQAANAAAPAPRIRLIELTPHLAVNDAAALIEAENYTDAIALLDEFNANQPEPVPEAFYLLALAHYQLGNFAQARLPAERAATLAPDAPVSWLELVADILKRTDNHRAAIEWLHKLIEKAPGNKTYWLELSLAYERVGDIEHSLATMRLAEGQNLLSEDADFRRLSDLLLVRGLPQQSAVVLEQALARQIVRGDEAAYTKLGTAWFTAGEPAKAVAPLENAARIANSGDGYVRLANVHITQRNWTAAVAALHAAMGRGSLTDEAHASLLMGVALYAQGRYDEASGYLTTAAESEKHRSIANEYLEAIEAATASSSR
jgi:tetratricopeptide (TPR) repeat protein